MMRSDARNEARHFWRLMNFVSDARMRDDYQELTELADEFDVLREMTNWPLLKERCTKMLDALQSTEKRIA